MKTILLGLGNPVLTDDAVGWRVVCSLQQRLRGRRDMDVKLCCRGGLGLMEQMIGYDRAIIVDAIRTGAPPGTVHRLGPRGIPTQSSASGHDVNLPTALELGRRIGAALPADDQIVVVGIEAQDVETFGAACTPAVAEAIPQAVEAVEARAP